MTYSNFILLKLLSVSSLLDGVRCGLTPNPDVLCNQFVKFQALHRWARDTLGMATIATGHYARVDHDNEGVCVTDCMVVRREQTHYL